MVLSIEEHLGPWYKCEETARVEVRGLDRARGPAGTLAGLHLILALQKRTDRVSREGCKGQGKTGLSAGLACLLSPVRPPGNNCAAHGSDRPPVPACTLVSAWLLG